jgi:Cu(I)/Ag(I) efflux system membrane fusion protein
MMNIMKNIVEDFQKSKNRWFLILLLLFMFFLGVFFRGCFARPDLKSLGHFKGGKMKSAAVDIWTCSMHPQIRQSKPGKCPICGMDLIPISGGVDETPGNRQIKLSERAAKLAEVETAPVERRDVSVQIRMMGKVAFDETRLKYITARVPGRIDRLFVDYTGVRVNKGEHLVTIYSPQLITAQQELIEAKKYGSVSIESVREKLLLLGLTTAQVADIEKRGKPSDQLVIYSPLGGVVIQKNVAEGQYVETGTRIYSIADLSRVWIQLDAYESDLPWIRYGQSVEFETEAYPGEQFTGRIAFIDPILDQHTRVVKVRVNADNAHMKLKPEMFVRAVVRSRLSASGRVMDEDLRGKWISPMHPEIIRDRPGLCDICGMALVRAEELGYAGSVEGKNRMPLVVPSSAPLVTGTRAVVYTAVPGQPGIFQGREVVLGPRAGDYYIIKKGLVEGERVVVSGAFKIDSDLQIKGQPSMMNSEAEIQLPDHHHKLPESEKAETKQNENEPVSATSPALIRNFHDIPAAFKKSVDLIISDYFDIQKALSNDQLQIAREASKKMLENLNAVPMESLGEKAHRKWMKLADGIKVSGRMLAQSSDIRTARVHFNAITGPVTEAVNLFSTGQNPIYRFHCPMAFDNLGAFWLQDHPETRNPYFGASMLSCKDSVEKLTPQKKEDRQ